MREYLPRLPGVLFIAIFVGALVSGSRMINTDSDLGRHLVFGNYILQSGKIPSRDLLSFTMAEQPRPPYEWLAQVIFAAAYRLLNLDGTVLVTAWVIALAFVLVYVDAAERSGLPFLAFALVLLAVAAASIHWLARPHVFTFLFLALWSRLLEKIRLGRSISLWAFPALMLLWANIHGGFIFGFLVWLAYFSDWLLGIRQRSFDKKTGKALAFIGGSALMVSFVTPDLWHNWAAVLRNNSAYILSHTAETMPPDLNTHGFWPFFALLALMLILLLMCWKQAARAHLLLLAAFALMSLLMARNIPLFTILAAPILTSWAGSLVKASAQWTDFEARLKRMGIAAAAPSLAAHGGREAAIALLVAAIFFVFHQARTGASFYRFDPRVFPVQAVDWLEAHPIEGPMFNDFNWGGYLLYRLWPRQRVFIDSQSDFYGEEFLRRYAEILTASQGWEAELNRYGVRWIIIPRESGLARAVESSTQWAALYTDSLAVIYVHR